MWTRLALLLVLVPSLAVAWQGGYGSKGARPAAQTSASLADLKKMEAYQQTTKAAYKKQANPKTKKAYVDATVKYGTACMNSDALDRKVKYKKALYLYREALKIDPSNKEAKENASMIESIYKSMGRPIP